MFGNDMNKTRHSHIESPNFCTGRWHPLPLASTGRDSQAQPIGRKRLENHPEAVGGPLVLPVVRFRKKCQGNSTSTSMQCK